MPVLLSEFQIGNRETREWTRREDLTMESMKDMKRQGKGLGAVHGP
jgi:hypothetical protein